jgi:uncharacterized protein with FMN-binding domain
MKVEEPVRMKRKGKRKMAGWIILLVIIAMLGTGGAIGWSYLSKEHKEALNLPLNTVNFSRLKDGTYTGAYEGGMYKWRANKAEVTVTSGKVSDIRLLSPINGDKELDKKEALYDRVMAAKSLQVDAVSGATLDSKAYLQAVENALKQAQK